MGCIRTFRAFGDDVPGAFAPGCVGVQIVLALFDIKTAIESERDTLDSLMIVDMFLRDRVAAEKRVADRREAIDAYERFFAVFDVTREKRNLPRWTMTFVPAIPPDAPRENAIVEIIATAAIPSMRV
jgi:enamine deaminase RidA (YjgF/YER057c/UK114 family)